MADIIIKTAQGIFNIKPKTFLWNSFRFLTYPALIILGFIFFGYPGFIFSAMILICGYRGKI